MAVHARIKLLRMVNFQQVCLRTEQIHKSQKRSLKIYTKTGDKGTSVTIAGDRRPKDDKIFEALGATDELSSAIGLAREFCYETSPHLIDNLQEIQCMLQDAGSNIATPKSLATENQIRVTEFDSEAVERLESWIDKYTEQLPALTNFILPGGGKASASLHMARSVCRRAERRLVYLTREEEVSPEVGRYLNRLSDFLFTAARIATQDEGKEDVIYRRKRPKKDKP